MDVDDPCGNDNFYDEIDSFMPPPGDYNLDDIDEILRSTNPVLDASLGFNTFDATSELYNFNIKNEFTPIGEPSFGLSNNFQTPSALLNDEQQQKSQTRNDSVTSMDGEHFNPDEFMNFLNDDNIKFEELTGDSDCSNNSIEDVLQRHRNTPSPTGSCSSSGGSSTSGVQSDASSIGSLTPAYVTQTEIINNFMDNEANQQQQQTPPAIVDIPITIQTPMLQTLQTTQVPVQTIVQPQIISNNNIISVKTLPTKAFSVVKPTNATPLKIEAKLTAKQLNNATPNIKLIPASNSTTTAAKISPPPNAKPKTIFLSSNDFKTLMQRMNSNGSKIVGNGAKINGAINTQMPKIIMKTPNGKVITASNKIVQPLNNSLGNKTALMSKIVTANGTQLVLKQNSSSSSAAASVVNATKSDSSDSNVFRGIMDEKIFKKQQRMIKNRESASLSRKKKKEYVVSLETRINNLEKENYTLKGENKSLRSQLVAFAQTCHCKHGNVSEFILNSLNAAEQKQQPVKIAPKPAPKSLKQRMTAANIRKNVAVLFAMAFMVSLNVGNFQNFLNRNTLDSNMAEQTAEEPLPQVATASGGRRLLWVETEAEFNEKLNRSKRESEIVMPPPPPPLHFLRPINRTTAGQQQHANATQNETKPSVMGMNQKENLRLASSLRKWIGGNANYLNLSLTEPYDNLYDDDLENPTGFKASTDYYDMKTYDLPLQQGNGPGSVIVGKQQKRKLYVDNNDGLTYDDNAAKKHESNENELENSLDIFKPKISEEYMRLFKGIKRQDDTFYVLSFNMDHILLPASNYNKSTRPKMSLMLPAGNPALNGDVTLMQIDCEVTNTTELMLKSFMIPEKLRPNTFSNNSNDVANNETVKAQKSKEQRFYKPTVAGRKSGVINANNDIDGEPEKKKPAIDKLIIPKQKPVVRTFYLMGPKTQAAADAAKEKPIIVGEYRGNETFVNNLSNVKNSTLYTKMRETNVEGFGTP